MEAFMAEEELEIEADVEIEDTEPELDEPEVVEDQDIGDDDETEEQEEGESEDSDDDELVVSFDGDEEEEKEDDSSVIRQMRKQLKAIKAENKDLKSNQKQDEVSELGPRPTLEQSGYDEDAHQDAVEAWLEKKREVEAVKEAEKEAQETLQKEYRQKVDIYNEGKKELSVKAKGFEEAEEEVTSTLSPARQGLLLEVSSNMPLLVLALGKNPKKLQELASIKSDVQFIAEAVRLESKMKATGVKSKPAPEKRVGGKSGAPSSSKKKLEQLREEAAKTGDMTKVLAFKARMSAQA